MSFFKRKEKNLIPPVAPEAPPPYDGAKPGGGDQKYRTTYNASRDGNLYDNSSYAPPAPTGNAYSRRDQDPDSNRQELFAGYNPDNARPNRFADGNGGGRAPGREPAPGEEEDEDVEGIKQQIRATKQESVNSTRNALRLAREAEETARGTLLRLGDQSGSFHCHGFLAIRCSSLCREIGQH
jgi:hypothetical protein